MASTDITYTKSLNATGDDLPNELLLPIFSHLPLKALIASRGVCRRWRYLVTSADLDPDRRSLLTLYLRALQTPSFLITRSEIVAALQPFDRNAFLQIVRDNGIKKLPKEFQMWIEEWPAKAAIGWIWPGLDWSFYRGETTVCRRHSFANTIGHNPPWIKSVTYHKRKSEKLRPDTLFQGHATSFLPFGIELSTENNLSWVEPENSDEAMGQGEDDAMVSFDLTVMCVQKSDVTGPEWLVLDGRRGGEEMIGGVFKGSYGMKAGDIISNNWIEFLERELKRGEEVLNGVVAPILVEFDALGISEFSFLFFFFVLPFSFCSSFPSRCDR